MGKTSRSQLAIAGVIAIALLLANIGVSLESTRRLREDAGLVEHTRQVLAILENILSMAKDAETGQRGYLITGERAYLGPYTRAIAAIDQKIADASNLTRDNDRQQERLAVIKAVWSEKLAEMEGTIREPADRGFEAARTRVLQSNGRVAMDHPREKVAEMLAEERTLLAERTKQADRTYDTALYGGLLAGFTALLSVAALLFLVRRYVAARDSASAALKATEQRFRQLADAMPQIVWAAGPMVRPTVTTTAGTSIPEPPRANPAPMRGKARCTLRIRRAGILPMRRRYRRRPITRSNAACAARVQANSAGSCAGRCRCATTTAGWSAGSALALILTTPSGCSTNSRTVRSGRTNFLPRSRMNCAARLPQSAMRFRL